MTRAEEQALKAYPIKMAVREGYDENLRERKGFAKGYNQASKDYIEYAQLWLDSGEVNFKTFKQFLKYRGYE